MKEWSLEMKRSLLEFCRREVDARIVEQQEEIASIQEAANQETKSSAGDKYETGRAMLQIERDQASERLAEYLRLMDTLDKVTVRNMDKVGLGAMVETSQGRFFFAAPLGKIRFQDEDWFALSLASPLGQLMTGRGKGETIQINGRSFELLQVR